MASNNQHRWLRYQRKAAYRWRWQLKALAGAGMAAAPAPISAEIMALRQRQRNRAHKPQSAWRQQLAGETLPAARAA